MSETTQNNQPNPPPRPPRGFPRRELPQIPQKPTRSNTSGQLQNLLEKEKQDLERGVLERSNSTNSISQRPNPTIQVPEENQVLYSLKKPPSPFSSSNSTSFSSSSSSTTTFSQNSTSNVNSTSSISSTNNSNLPPVSGQTRTNRSYSTKPVPSIPIRTRALSGGASELKNAVEKINTTPKEETEFGEFIFIYFFHHLSSNFKFEYNFFFLFSIQSFLRNKTESNNRNRKTSSFT